MNNLFLSSDKKNFVAEEDNMSVSTFSKKSFFGNKVSFNLEIKNDILFYLTG